MTAPHPITSKVITPVVLLSLCGLPLLTRSHAASILPKTAAEAAISGDFDAAPYALALPDRPGLLWEDPREVHKVIVEFDGAAPDPAFVRLEYWGSRWPEQHLPKDRQPGGGSVGWMELGNWYKYGWREADTDVTAQGSTLTFTFRPVNAKEFKNVKDYPAAFRYTLKLRLKSQGQLPKVQRLQAFTDSKWTQKSARLAFKKGGQKPAVEVFNGEVINLQKEKAGTWLLQIKAAENSDPNTFDRTLVTIKSGKAVFTFGIDDLEQDALYLPQYGAAILAEGDDRGYADLEQAQQTGKAKTLYQRVGEMPEQTWSGAWNGMPRKRTHIYFPMGLDGGRQRFRLNANGTINFRSNDHYLNGLKGKDTPRLALEPAPVRVSFGDYPEPVDRTIDDASIPICSTTWDKEGYRVVATAVVTELGGTRGDGPVPAPDTFAVFMARFVFTNTSSSEVTVKLPFNLKAGEQEKTLRADDSNLLWVGDNLRAQMIADGKPSQDGNNLVWSWTLEPGKSVTAVFKVPYVVLTEAGEREALTKLDFNKERTAVAGYWRKRLNESARLITPEPMLNEFYRAHAGHLLINCEKEPDAERRFARVGSFGYGAYGNESCMMVVDLERRGYHKEAQECLDGWLHYQGTVMLPGDFSSKEGILYGAAGYEAGGYNQHHGWILWMLAEHYRFTRDNQWLEKAAPGIVAGADWIIRETKRTLDRHPLERGLLPAGSLEDIGDWWTWLSTSCYMWRGLDSAAWALEQAKHPEAKRVRREADLYHQNLVANFRAASQRSPVVRLRDGTAISKIPSYVHRRGRSFGWICETLEGALHLMITRAIDPKSAEGTWIVEDYEDNLYLSNQYGYTLDNFEEHWFGRGGMSMQACLLLDVEPYLYRDDVKHALRALFNGLAVSYFPDVRMNTEHALPNMQDWTGDHYKSSDESNAAGWLRYLFVREDGDKLLIGQAIPREWLKEDKRCGMDRAATYFGNLSVMYTGGKDSITSRLDGPRRNPPKNLLLRFRTPNEAPIKSVTVNGKSWKQFKGDWVELPGDIARAEVIANY